MHFISLYFRDKLCVYRFRDLRGLNYVLAVQIDRLETAHSGLTVALDNLNKPVTQETVNKAVTCCLRPTLETEEKYVPSFLIL